MPKHPEPTADADRDALVSFAKFVLYTLEEDTSWGADTVDLIRLEADRLGLSYDDGSGLFCMAERLKP